MHSQPLTTHPQGAATPSGIEQSNTTMTTALRRHLHYFCKHLQDPAFKKTANISDAVILVLILFVFSVLFLDYYASAFSSLNVTWPFISIGRSQSRREESCWFSLSFFSFVSMRKLAILLNFCKISLGGITTFK